MAFVCQKIKGLLTYLLRILMWKKSQFAHPYLLAIHRLHYYVFYAVTMHLFTLASEVYILIRVISSDDCVHVT